MESGLKLYTAYRDRALSELKQLDEFSETLLTGTLISRAYYSVFYTMKAKLALIEVVTSSHKQTLIEFRKRFIKSGDMPKEYSKILTKLFEMRELADYDVMWSLPREEVKEILVQVRGFVTDVLEA